MTARRASIVAGFGLAAALATVLGARGPARTVSSTRFPRTLARARVRSNPRTPARPRSARVAPAASPRSTAASPPSGSRPLRRNRTRATRRWRSGSLRRSLLVSCIRWQSSCSAAAASSTTVSPSPGTCCATSRSRPGRPARDELRGPVLGHRRRLHAHHARRRRALIFGDRDFSPFVGTGFSSTSAPLKSLPST